MGTKQGEQKTKSFAFGSLATFIVILGVIFPYAFPKLFPFGVASIRDPPVFSDIDYSNDSLTFARGKLGKIWERVEKGSKPLLENPETVLFDHEGTMYVTTEAGALLKLTQIQLEEGDDRIWTAKVTTIVNPGLGRILGAKFASSSDGTLYLANPSLGLLRVRNVGKSNQSPIEFLASKAPLERGSKTMSEIMFADDVDIGPKTGHVYFSDASDIPPIYVGFKKFDVLHSSIMDATRGKASGRLLRYKPETDEIDTLASGIHFANGIAVDPKDEAFLIVSSTFGVHAKKYHLTGPKAGTIEVIVPELPGTPDGADCAIVKTNKKGAAAAVRCYLALFTSVTTSFSLMYSLPSYISWFVRTLVLLAPRGLSPAPNRFGAVAEFDPADGQIRRIIQDPRGVDYWKLSGVTEHKGKLYLGSLGVSFVGVYDLSED